MVLGQGAAILQWLTLWPDSKEVPLGLWGGLRVVGSPHVFVGSISVLPLPPTVRDMPLEDR